ncbi:hypothetical protein D3C85_889960 [compost metagenome]
MEYGAAPKVLGEFDLEPSEFCYVQYLPIALPRSEIAIPPNLLWVKPLLDCVDISVIDHVYLTVKCMFVSGTDCGNRPGWHSDGFGTDDLNYIWCDRSPTEFAIQPFKLSADCSISMQEMEDQFIQGTEVVYPPKTLLLLDQGVIHRTPTYCEPGYRTFVKISISKHRYNLKGNAHNHMLNYDWEMVERNVERNHPTTEVGS